MTAEEWAYLIAGVYLAVSVLLTWAWSRIGRAMKKPPRIPVQRVERTERIRAAA